MAKKKKPNPYIQDAQNASIIRYGPELSSLTALLRQAEEDRDLRLRQAQSGRQFAVGAVDQALPAVRKAYAGATTAIAPAFTTYATPGGGIEGNALAARMAETQALAQSQLQARRVSAIEGEGAAKSAALRDFRSDRGKIGQRALDLSRESGAFVSQTVNEMTGNAAAAKAAARKQQEQIALQLAMQSASLTQQERNSIRSSGIDPNTGKPIPGGRLDPAAKPKPKPKSGWRSPKDHAAFASQVNDIASWATKWPDLVRSSDPRSARAKLVEKLRTGREARSGWADPKTHQPVAAGTPGAVPYTLAKIPAYKADLAMSAALDIALAGHLSKTTQRRIHQAGLKLSDLGLTTFGEYERKNKRGKGYTLPMAGRTGTVTSHDQLPG